MCAIRVLTRAKRRRVHDAYTRAKCRFTHIFCLRMQYAYLRMQYAYLPEQYAYLRMQSYLRVQNTHVRMQYAYLHVQPKQQSVLISENGFFLQDFGCYLDIQIGTENLYIYIYI